MTDSPVLSVKTDSFEMEYLRFGTGSRVFVILPGLSLKSVMLSADAVASAFKAFTDRYTVYLFDKEKDIREGYGNYEIAEDTAEAMRILGIADADIFGASQGGMIAMCIALRRPELVRTLYLASTLSRPNAVSVETFNRWATLAKNGDVENLNRDIFKRVYSPEFYQANHAAFSGMEKDGTSEELRRMYIQSKACRDFDIYDRLDELKCRVFVVASEKDAVLSAQGSREIAEKLGCPIRIYEDYSHAVYDEAPDFRINMLSDLNS